MTDWMGEQMDSMPQYMTGHPLGDNYDTAAGHHDGSVAEDGVHPTRWSITDTSIEADDYAEDAELPGEGDLIVDCSTHGPIGRIEEGGDEHAAAAALFRAHAADVGEADPTLPLGDVLGPRTARRPARETYVDTTPQATYRGQPMPVRGDMVRTHATTGLSARGYSSEHYVGAVLWADAHRRDHVTVVREGGRETRSVSSSEVAEIQLDDGRVAHLDSVGFGSGDGFEILDAPARAGHAAVLAAADGLDAQADAVTDERAAATLRRQALDMRAAAGVAPERPEREQGPRLPNILERLDSDTDWWTGDARRIPIAAMGPRHVRNTLAYLERNARQLYAVYSTQGIFHSAPDDVIASLDAGAEGDGPREWLDEQPAVRALRARAAADLAQGVSDEGPPAEHELAGWRERNKLAADGSQDHAHPNPPSKQGAPA